MFAVPGWSVSADTLKTEKITAEKPDGESRSKKRKRGTKGLTEEVTASNVADLWASVVEGRKATASETAKPNPQAKKPKKKKEADASAKPKGNGEERQADHHQNGSEQLSDAQPNLNNRVQEPKKKKGKNKKHSKHNDSHGDGDEASRPAPDVARPGNITQAPLSSSSPSSPPPLPPAPSKLTPLQAAMREKLISARFRHLNETLYTRPSVEAFQLFRDAPEMFDEYHEGFRRQVKVWPENPVDALLSDIRTRAKARTHPGRSGQKPPATGNRLTVAVAVAVPLPRTAGTCTIADLGCGDARLAQSLQADQARLRVDVKSYDLQSPHALVTKADMANLPLEDGSINVAVFCLALMGTNWVDFIEEAYRVLHWKGELWVAEIKSRFGPVRKANAPVSHSVGNNRKKAAPRKGNSDKGEKGALAESEERNGGDLVVEVDGMEDRRRETDVSAFVEVLRSRGFIIQGDKDDSVDLSNKMFVKMRFIKGASPTKGKGVKDHQEVLAKGKEGKLRWPAAEDDRENAEVNEASVLKPCVYKLR